MVMRISEQGHQRVTIKRHQWPKHADGPNI